MEDQLILVKLCAQRALTTITDVSADHARDLRILRLAANAIVPYVHTANVPRDVRAALDDLCRSVYLASGKPIERESLEHVIRCAHSAQESLTQAYSER